MHTALHLHAFTATLDTLCSGMHATMPALRSAAAQPCRRMPACSCRRHSSFHRCPAPVQPEAVRAAIDAVLAQPLDALGDALQGFTWEFESKASGEEQSGGLGCLSLWLTLAWLLRWAWLVGGERLEAGVSLGARLGCWLGLQPLLSSWPPARAGRCNAAGQGRGPPSNATWGRRENSHRYHLMPCPNRHSLSLRYLYRRVMCTIGSRSWTGLMPTLRCAGVPIVRCAAKQGICLWVAFCGNNVMLP